MKVINELKKDYAFNMATLKQRSNSTSQPPRNKKYIYRNQRIIDLMNRYEKGSLTLEEYFNKISKTIDQKSKL